MVHCTPLPQNQDLTRVLGYAFRSLDGFKDVKSKQTRKSDMVPVTQTCCGLYLENWGGVDLWDSLAG